MLAKAAGVPKTSSALSWLQLTQLAAPYVAPDPANGPAHSQSLLRTFGLAEDAVRVTLYRDNHAWCPYCQKVWLWLEEVFGPLGESMHASAPQRRLERQLFAAWCDWLCRPSSSPASEATKQHVFEEVLQRMENELSATPGAWMRGGEQPSTADIVFVPYVERMSASLYYYKGFTMRDSVQRPALCRWFSALESRDSYRGTQSDFHTHVHDLPPQMGGCYASNSPAQRANAARVDNGPWVPLLLPPTAIK